MITQNDNVNKLAVKKIIEYDGSEKQITFLDTRFYKRKDKYYPSVTYVLSFIPKSKIFIDWIREKGDESETIVKAAAEKGKQTHGAIERLLEGEEILWINDQGNANYSLEVWQMILKFKEFWEIHKPKLIASEVHTFSDKYEFAGTVDLVLEMNSELWLVDIKTSNYIHPVYHFQTAAYTQAWNECYDTPIVRRGVLWLKSQTRKADKSGKNVQGKGWKLIESPRGFEKDFESFQLFHQVYKHEVDYEEPYFNIFPTSAKLNIYT